jgi:hypothetical protein
MYLDEKNYFMRSTNFKLLSQIKGNSVNVCDFIKFIISYRVSHCDYSSWAPKKPIRALIVEVLRSKPICPFEGQEVLLLIGCGLSRDLNRSF